MAPRLRPTGEKRFRLARRAAARFGGRSQPTARRAERKRSTDRRHSEARAERLAALVVAAVEGEIVLSRAERHPGRGSRAAELEDVIASALP